MPTTFARQARAQAAYSAAAAAANPLPPGAVILPYDYAASFPLSGRPGNVLQDVVNVSPDGIFVATAIGYGFEEDRARGLKLLPSVDLNGNAVPRTFTFPGDITLGEIPVDALITGFRVNPALHALLFRGEDGANGAAFSPARIAGLSDTQVAPNVLDDDDPRTGVLQRIKAGAELSFLFSMVDSATGRELQDEPTHNIASLGASDGNRPFRQLATPLMFQPRTSLRVQVIERTADAFGTLFIVLYGYKILTGTSVCPEPVLRRLIGPPATPLETVGRPDQRVAPFDQVVTVPLDGQPHRLHEREVALSTEAAFVVTAIGYGLLAESAKVPLDFNRRGEVREPTLRGEIDAMVAARQVNLARVPLRLFPSDALIDGIRFAPALLRLALGAGGRLANALPLPLADQVFTRLNQPGDVAFRYSFFEGGRGSELQNIALNNIAGLGTATGDRPFKRLSRSLVFMPRSTLRITVEEFFGRGTLFFAFQGYKLIDGAGQRGGRP